jgi:hypothetical protein
MGILTWTRHRYIYLFVEGPLITDYEGGNMLFVSNLVIFPFFFNIITSWTNLMKASSLVEILFTSGNKGHI